MNKWTKYSSWTRRTRNKEVKALSESTSMVHKTQKMALNTQSVTSIAGHSCTAPYISKATINMGSIILRSYELATIVLLLSSVCKYISSTTRSSQSSLRVPSWSKQYSLLICYFLYNIDNLALFCKYQVLGKHASLLQLCTQACTRWNKMRWRLETWLWTAK